MNHKTNTDINEGQTQVYSDGRIDAQHGVDTTTPHLNNPPQQLLDIAAQFYKSGKTDSQVLAILVGMGIPQQLALSGVSFYKSKLETYNENNKQKNNNEMNFTLTQLYENIMNSIDILKTMDSDSSRISYSSKNALKVLEESLGMFPRELNLWKSYVAIHNNELNDETGLKESIELNINPNLKFKIAKTLHRSLSIYEWLSPVKNLRDYIDTVYTNVKWSFKISEAIDTNKLQKGKLYETLINDLTESLKEPADIKSNLAKIATKHPWASSVYSILNEMTIDDNKAATNNDGIVSQILSPVVENENGLNFVLHGKTYAIKDNQITESVVRDHRFFNVLEGLQLFKNINNSLVIFGQNNKSLEYNLTEGTLMLNKTNLTELTPTQIKESLLAVNFFGYKNTMSTDTVAKFFESIDYLRDMDMFTHITSREFAALHLTLIAIGEGVWVNKVNSGMQINEMSFIPTATEAVKLIKEFINYDVSLILSEQLIAEGDASLTLSKKRNELSETISFLIEKKTEINSAISKNGKSEELDEALTLINAELIKFEKELQESYLVSEKKNKKQYLDDGFVDANIIKPSAGFSKGQQIMVNAEEYSSLGNDDLVTIIDPMTNKESFIIKNDIKVEI
jgi:CRISPR/Cas system CMR-associated protein Cmr5 small subunit